MKGIIYISMTILLFYSILNKAAGQSICIALEAYTPIAADGANEVTICPGSAESNNSVSLRAYDCATGENILVNWDDPNGFTINNLNAYTAADIGVYTAKKSGYTSASITVKHSVTFTPDLYKDKARTQAESGILKCEYEEKVYYASLNPDITGYSWYDTNDPTVIFGNGDSLLFPKTEISEEVTAFYAYNATYQGCEFKKEFFFRDGPAPETNIRSDTGFCQGSSLFMSLPTSNNTGTNNYNYQWFASDGTSLSTNQWYEFTAIGTYSVRTLDNYSCRSIDTFNVYQFLKPVLTLSNDTLICPNSSVSLTAEARDGNGPYSFYWKPGKTLSDSTITNTSTAVVTATPSTPTTYQVLVVDTKFCSDTNSVSVGFRPAVVATVPFSDTSACAGYPIFLNASGTAGTPYSNSPAYSYLWTPASEIINGSNTATPQVSPADTVIYTVVVTDSIGCSDSTTVRVKTPDMSVNIAGRPEIFACSGDSVTLSSNVQGGIPSASGYNYLWESVAYLESASNASSKAFTLTDGTEIKLTATDSRGCAESDSVILRIGSLPQVTAPVNQYYLCLNDSVQIDAVSVTGGTGGTFLSWSVPAKLSDAASDAPRYYSGSVPLSEELVVSVTDAQGCVGNTDTVSITTIAPPLVNVGADTSGCQGTPIIVTNNSYGNTLSYEWYLLNGTTILDSDSSLQVNTAGTYTVIVRDPAASCESRDTVNVSFIIPPSYLLIQTDTVAPNHLPLELTAISDGQNLQYLWSSNGAGFLVSTTTNPTIYDPSETDLDYVTFTLSVTNGCGPGMSVDTIVRFYFDETNLPALVYIPNAFSPDADNPQNKSLMVFGNKISQENFLFRVYSRWGDLLYETNQFVEANTTGWNGINENTGEPMHGGVYSYTVKGQFEDGKVFENTGTVNLIR